MTKFKPLPTQAELHELFDYSVVTGELYWRKRTSNRIKAGDVAGWFSKAAKKVRVNGESFLIHRLIWRFVTGEDPLDSLVDHINGDPSLNAFHNLRLANRAQNRINTKKTLGYYFNPKERKYISRIQLNSSRHFLGAFNTEAEARAAYEKASKALHGEFSAV